MKYLIEIDTANDAFLPDPAVEVTNALAQLTNRIKLFGLEPETLIRDTNGNTVGKARLEKEHSS